MSPESNAAVPDGVAMLPLFTICGAIKATVPPANALMLPLFSIDPACEFESRSKIYLLFRKSELFKFKVLAIKLPASNLAPCPKITPLGFIKMTCPFALSDPKI